MPHCSRESVSLFRGQKFDLMPSYLYPIVRRRTVIFRIEGE
jgi:hypothetical protein